jgi:hypothetical protein
MPNRVHVIIDYLTHGLFWGWIPKIVDGVYAGTIHSNGESFGVEVYFCNFSPDSATIDSIVAGWATVEGVGCDSFIGITDSGNPFWVGVEET